MIDENELKQIEAMIRKFCPNGELRPAELVTMVLAREISINSNYLAGLNNTLRETLEPVKQVMQEQLKARAH